MGACAGHIANLRWGVSGVAAAGAAERRNASAWRERSRHRLSLPRLRWLWPLLFQSARRRQVTRRAAPSAAALTAIRLAIAGTCISLRDIDLYHCCRTRTRMWVPVANAEYVNAPRPPTLTQHVNINYHITEWVQSRASWMTHAVCAPRFRGRTAAAHLDLRRDCAAGSSSRRWCHKYIWYLECHRKGHRGVRLPQLLQQLKLFCCSQSNLTCTYTAAVPATE